MEHCRSFRTLLEMVIHVVFAFCGVRAKIALDFCKEKILIKNVNFGKNVNSGKNVEFDKKYVNLGKNVNSDKNVEFDKKYVNFGKYVILGIMRILKKKCES